ncbi:MAG: Spore protein SP21 [bacterium ADurb.Bin400]|nr:MAG: Spore protein SP21 [bacterium ADurb.Bin400]
MLYIINMNESELSIENRLKELRKQHKLSQEDLAEALGISRQSVIALEQGKYLPSLPIVVSMCRFFDKAFEEIFDFDKEVKAMHDRLRDNSIKVTIIKGKNLGPGKEKVMNTELDPWRPFRESLPLRDAVDRLLSESFITPRTVGPAMPKVDIRERKEDVVVRAELPGVKEEDIDVEVSSDGVITISGEKKEEKEEKEEGYFYKETYSGSFSRTFSLPTEVVADKAQAEVDGGILTVTIPKAKPEKTQKLKISAKKKSE